MGDKPAGNLYVYFSLPCSSPCTPLTTLCSLFRPICSLFFDMLACSWFFALLCTLAYHTSFITHLSHPYLISRVIGAAVAPPPPGDVDPDGDDDDAAVAVNVDVDSSVCIYDASFRVLLHSHLASHHITTLNFTPPLHHSTTSSRHDFITPPLHHSTTLPLHHSTTLPLHHFNTSSLY
jgi:hypothetical protein